MLDPLLIARDRLAKSEAKLQRLEKQVETVRSEVADLRTTVRVMAEITGEAAPEAAPSPGERQLEILAMLPEGEHNADSPVSLFETYRLMGSDTITLDTFRTTLWRMKDTLYITDFGEWSVRNHNGRYWKEHPGEKKAPDAETSRASNPAGLAGSGGSASHPASDGSSPSRSTHVPVSFDADLDDDPPF